MLFTIAIPTYNGADMLGDAIASAVNQDYDGDYEILIVNNNSSDHTQEVIESFKDPRIRVIRNKETVDQFENHNICFREAIGDYILFCHTDDFLLPDALKILNKELENLLYPKKFIIWGHSMFRDFYKYYQKAGQPIGTVIGGEEAPKAFLNWGLTPSGTCYSREAIISLGLFPPMKTNIDSLDWYIVIVAAYNRFEFKMMDRLIYIREEAHVAVRSLTDKDWFYPTGYVFDMVQKNLGEKRKHDFIYDLSLNANMFHYPYLKRYLSKTSRIKFLVRSFRKSGYINPKFFLKYMFKKYNPPIGSN